MKIRLHIVYEGWADYDLPTDTANAIWQIAAAAAAPEYFEQILLNALNKELTQPERQQDPYLAPLVELTGMTYPGCLYAPAEASILHDTDITIHLWGEWNLDHPYAPPSEPTGAARSTTPPHTPPTDDEDAAPATQPHPVTHEATTRGTVRELLATSMLEQQSTHIQSLEQIHNSSPGLQGVITPVGQAMQGFTAAALNYFQPQATGTLKATSAPMPLEDLVSDFEKKCFQIAFQFQTAVKHDTTPGLDTAANNALALIYDYGVLCCQIMCLIPDSSDAALDAGGDDDE